MATVLDDIDDPVNVFVVSDHGIGQRKKWAIALNTWLRNEGHLETTTDRQPRQQGWLDVAVADGRPDDETNDNVASTLANVGLTRQRIERILSTVGLYDVARKVVPDGLKNTVEEEVVDQAASDAFYQSVGFSGVDTGITLNSAEFYDNGTLSPTEYEHLRKKIIEKLRALEGPKGNAFSRVRPREAVYDGPQMYCAPDIILEQAPEYVIGSGRPRGKLFIRTESGRIDHTRDGLLLAAGPDIDSDWSLTNQPSIADVTPTLLSVLRCPLNERFDGTPLTSIIAADSDSEYRSYDAYTPHSDYRVSNENRDALRDRLSQMGYLE
jgi:predicted AlkP superfamily phosphohydrolase/phosphomutase